MTGRAGSYHVYILRCADASYYTGMSSDLRLRIDEHHQGLDPTAYTFGRRPVTLVWCQEFSTHDEAFRAEQQIKGWTRAKKEALIRGNFEETHRIVRKEWENEARGSPGEIGSGPASSGS
jgi:predicted GIY-YIG superfamily endonuclease